VKQIERLGEACGLDPDRLEQFVKGSEVDRAPDQATAANTQSSWPARSFYLGDYRRGGDLFKRLEAVTPQAPADVAAQFMTASSHVWTCPLKRLATSA
jgi:hypothetical protein